MATELGKTNTLQAMADATGIIYDRSSTQEKVVGQAWLIAKSRLVTLASLVSNYAEAPWALVVKFPHPDLTYSVKSIFLHPDFNKREARDFYLAQIHTSHLQMPQFDNDIATINIDAEMTAITPERMAEINRALSVPFPIGPQDLSGVMKPGEAINIIQSALGTGRSGLLSMLDSRNLPFARMSIRNGKIVRAIYGELTNELAFCELMWRRPSGNFVFQATDQFNWPELPEISMPTEQLAAEAGRRVQEIPKILEMLGGPEVRFQKISKQPDFSTMNPAQKWVAERLWACLDGYLVLGRISERINSDTFTILKTLWELRGAGLVAPSQQQPFSYNGQLGPLIMPATELEVTAWDPVSSFYLDPISGGPSSEQGVFVGGGKVLASKVLVHTIPVPHHVRGALVLKEGRLIGIHSGPFTPNAQPKLPFPLYQMTYIGALSDLGTKRLRSTSEFSPEESDLEQSTSTKLAASMRGKLGGELDNEPVPSERPPVPEETGWEFLNKYSKNQMAAAAGISMVVALFMVILSVFGPKPVTVVTTTSTTPGSGTPGTTSSTTQDVGKAIALAAGFAGFQEKPADSYRWEDTSETTPGKDSFGLVSDRQNQKVLFVVSDTIPYDHLDTFTSELPYLRYRRQEGGDWVVKQGTQDKVKYLAGKYVTAKNEPVVGMVGAFLSPTNPQKSILVVSYPVDPTKQSDFANTLALIEDMTAPAPVAGAGGGDTTTATTDGSAGAAADPAQYRKSVQAAIQKRYKAPAASDDDGEFDSLVSIEFTIGAQGQITKIVITKPGGEKYSQALQKAITSSAPFGKPPDGQDNFNVVATMDGTKLTVDEP